MKPLIAAAVLSLCISAANAQQQHLVTHNGSLMQVTQDRAGVIRIGYVDPRPGLQAIGVGPGVQLVTGRWVAKGRFEGVARVFACGFGYEYAVTGGLADDGVLLLEGPAPVIAPWCFVTGLTWLSDNAHLVFIPYQQ